MLQGKVALVTGGDSGIGRAVCYNFALEGATVAFTYVKGPEDKDAEDALELIRKAKVSNAHAIKHMKEGSCIINTASVLAYKGEETLVDYSATKGAIVTFTRSLALQLIKRGIRVNGVAPGPIWTPLEVASLPVERVVTFGSEAAMDRAGQPFELAPSYVFLASNDCSSYFTGQFLHPNGGMIVNA
ncbi:hypothetical protein SOVF_117810 isoform B [Spinacia oleracea]|nr:hypothetical protein SOVF_117810 isoform B [Spinacia oleracea]